MHLPDDVNPAIIWDQEKGMWVDTSKNSPPPPDYYHQWPGRDLTMVYDQATGNWVDRKREMCGVSLGPGKYHPNQQKMHLLLQELGTKNVAILQTNLLAGQTSPAECKEKVEAVRVILSEAAKIPSPYDPASTEGAMRTEATLCQIQNKIYTTLNRPPDSRKTTFTLPTGGLPVVGGLLPGATVPVVGGLLPGQTSTTGLLGGVLPGVSNLPVVGGLLSGQGSTTGGLPVVGGFLSGSRPNTLGLPMVGGLLAGTPIGGLPIQGDGFQRMPIPYRSSYN